MEKTWKAINITPEDFFDMVEKQKHQFDTVFGLKRWRPVPELYPESTNSVIGKILDSPRVKETINQVLQGYTFSLLAYFSNDLIIGCH